MQVRCMGRALGGALNAQRMQQQWEPNMLWWWAVEW
eukprot:CAMPEP_0202879798 /NCGR_PEP_ID=MMETSP1391-20130828/34119_1 /ASSEMBLY_ACC=CAM_ASM_000867 /TAXON_ID=1034604 /ORGANISM="Chlamydomonas leiostraca, Strain SAG 11-49" /LENGTH=35 /DNA_ID= /DNA_START= /DNA_END= /DNA_ORIENTATION=